MRSRTAMALLLLVLAAVPAACGDDGMPRVLLVGDSIMGQTAPALSRALNREADVRNESVAGSGLLSPWYVDWPAELRRLFDAYDPDVVVFLFVGNYRTGSGDESFETADGHRVENRTDPAFARAWRAQAQRLTDQATDGAEVLWVLPPPMGDPVDEEIVTNLREAYEEVAADSDIELIDADESLATPDGSFDPTLRSADGVHLSPEGARRLGEQLASALESRL